MNVVQETLDRYKALKEFVIRLVAKLDGDVVKWREFSSAHGSLILQLSQLDAKLTQIQHLDDAGAGDANETNRIKLEKLSVRFMFRDVLSGLNEFRRSF